MSLLYNNVETDFRTLPDTRYETVALTLNRLLARNLRLLAEAVRDLEHDRTRLTLGSSRLSELCSCHDLPEAPLRLSGGAGSDRRRPPLRAQQEHLIQSAAAVVSPAPWIDRVYDRITRFFNARVRAMDSYFAQHEPVDAEQESQLQVRLWLQHEDSELDFKPVVSTNLQMPNLERRLDLYVENITQNLLPGSDPVESDTRLRVGARGDLFRGGRWAVTRDLGVGFSHGVKLYAQVTGHFRWYWRHWEGSQPVAVLEP